MSQKERTQINEDLNEPQLSLIACKKIGISFVCFKNMFNKDCWRHNRKCQDLG